MEIVALEASDLGHSAKSISACPTGDSEKLKKKMKPKKAAAVRQV